MIAFPTMLVAAAKKAGMSVPEDPDKFEEARDEHPHFFCFCILQLARPVVYHGEHWDNAKVIADIPTAEVMELTLEGFLDKGLSFAH